MVSRLPIIGTLARLWAWNSEKKRRERNDRRAIDYRNRREDFQAKQDALYDELRSLESRNDRLVQEGRETKSEISRRRLASQIKTVRDAIARTNTKISVYQQKMGIMDAFLHNHEIRQAIDDSLPTSHELTDELVRAEETMEALSDATDVLETVQFVSEPSREEQNIMKEFEVETLAEEKFPSPPIEIPEKHRAERKKVPEV